MLHRSLQRRVLNHQCLHRTELFPCLPMQWLLLFNLFHGCLHFNLLFSVPFLPRLIHQSLHTLEIRHFPTRRPFVPSRLHPALRPLPPMLLLFLLVAHFPLLSTRFLLLFHHFFRLLYTLLRPDYRHMTLDFRLVRLLLLLRFHWLI